MRGHTVLLNGLQAGSGRMIMAGVKCHMLTFQQLRDQDQWSPQGPLKSFSGDTGYKINPLPLTPPNKSPKWWKG